MADVIALKHVIRSRLSRAVTIGLIALASTAPAVSAQRLFGVLDGAVVELGASPSRLGTPVGMFALPACLPYPATRFWPVDYGRYLAWDRLDGVCLLDMLAGSVRSIDLPDTSIALASAETFGLVLRNGAALSVLPDPAGSVVPTTLTATGYPAAVAIAASTREVVSFEPNATGTDAVVASLDSGQVVRRVALPPATVYAANGSATAFAAASFDFLGSTLATFDGAGVLLRTLAPLDIPYPFSAERSLVFAGDAELRVLTHGGLARLDAGTLGVTGVIDVGRARFTPQAGWSAQVGVQAFDARPAQAVFIEQEWHDYSYSQHDLKRITLSAVDLTTSRTEGQFELYRAYGIAAYQASFFLVAPPPTPATPTVDVSGGRVTLTWPAVRGATHYRLEAGTAPGLSNIGAFDVAGTSFTAATVPAGRYYVRVRAAGVGGLGTRSSAAAVTVP